MCINADISVSVIRVHSSVIVQHSLMEGKVVSVWSLRVEHLVV